MFDDGDQGFAALLFALKMTKEKKILLIPFYK